MIALVILLGENTDCSEKVDLSRSRNCGPIRIIIQCSAMQHRAVRSPLGLFVSFHKDFTRAPRAPCWTTADDRDCCACYALRVCVSTYYILWRGLWSEGNDGGKKSCFFAVQAATDSPRRSASVQSLSVLRCDG